MEERALGKALVVLNAVRLAGRYQLSKPCTSGRQPLVSVSSAGRCAALCADMGCKIIFRFMYATDSRRLANSR